MGRAHLVVGAGIALTAFVYLGCAAKPNTAAQQHPQQQANRRGMGVPVARRSAPQSQVKQGGAPEAPAASAGEVTPKSIAQHAQVYAQNLESLLTKRAGSAGHAATQEPAKAAPVEAQQPSVMGKISAGLFDIVKTALVSTLSGAVAGKVAEDDDNKSGNGQNVNQGSAV